MCALTKTRASKKYTEHNNIQDDLSLKLLDHQSCPKVNKHIILLFQHSFIPVSTRPTRISKLTQL